jgi:L-lactate dehydrogenase complex protein LldE
VRVSLLVTCLIDLLEPDTGADVVKVLRAAGCEVDCPEGQTCCGQPAWNAGFAEEAAKVARTTLDALESADSDAVVVPAGSCATMIRVFWPELFEVVGDHAAADRARAVGARTKELTELLVERELPAMEVLEECRVAYHHSCHLLRELHGHDHPLQLLDDVGGCTRVEWTASERCCGFGGLFSLKLPEVSVAMADDKLASLDEQRPDMVVSADSSCLMHLRSRAAHEGKPIETRHIAQVLAAGLEGKAP